MLSTMFVASSDNFDVEDFARKHDINSETCWIKGTKNTIGKEYKTSGFKFDITDEENTSKHFDDLKKFIHSENVLLKELRDKNIDLSFDIGFTIDAPNYVARLIDIDKDLLKDMSDVGLGVSIAAYLASEED